jgi:microcystin-dependent protein
MITAWGGNTAPAGWLECNGQSTAPYPVLGSIVGGVVPDLRGEFIRGWDHGRGVDAGRGLRSFQNALVGNHQHLLPIGFDASVLYAWTNGDHFPIFGSTVVDNTLRVAENWDHPVAGPHHARVGYTQHGADAQDGTSNRPRNISLMYIIKHD